MKRFISLILAIVMLSLILVSCDGNNGTGSSGDNSGNSGDNSGNSGDNSGNSGDDTNTPSYGNEIGDLCRALSLERVDGDGRVSIDDYRGKVVVINFWGTWCDPCKNELPHFDEVATEYKDDVVILAIHSVQGKKNAPTYISEHYSDSDMVFLYDESLSSGADKYYTMLGCSGGYPTTIVLDKDGIRTYKKLGIISKDALVSAIEDATN